MPRPTKARATTRRSGARPWFCCPLAMAAPSACVTRQRGGGQQSFRGSASLSRRRVRGERWEEGVGFCHPASRHPASPPACRGARRAARAFSTVRAARFGRMASWARASSTWSPRTSCATLFSLRWLMGSAAGGLGSVFFFVGKAQSDETRVRSRANDGRAVGGCGAGAGGGRLVGAWLRRRCADVPACLVSEGRCAPVALAHAIFCICAVSL